MKSFFFSLALLLTQVLYAQTIYYVKPSGSDASNGTSWATAFKTLQKALSTISSGEIWVAAGTYYPDEGPGQDNNGRVSTFELKNSVAIYGGFAGTETSPSQRNLVINETILSGDLLKDDTPNWGNIDDNAWHVVSCGRSIYATAILDGLTITAGNAGTLLHPKGGGMNNRGDDPVNRSTPLIRNCRFIGNHAQGEGGAMYNEYASPTIINCIFSDNRANWGGVMKNYNSSPNIINCTFTRNTADNHGGVLANETYAAPSIKNSILWDNGPDQIYLYGTSIIYSIVQGGWSGSGNKNVDPLFTADLRLQGCSPAINAGTGSGAPVIDIEGKPRPALGGYDMGAYEVQQAGIGGRIYVNASAPAGGDGTSWTRAFNYLQDALAQAPLCNLPTEIWVEAGIYYPDINSAVNSNDPMASFILKNNVALYGGFAGNEKDRIQRNWQINISILSGDVDGVDGNAHNSLHVVRSSGVNSTAQLDGFTITGGNASGTSVYGEGAGMYNDAASPTVANCHFYQNSAAFVGGAVYNKNSSPAITGCSFFDNIADISGGAIYNEVSSPAITSCSFHNNTATHYGSGGAIANSSSSPVITSCSFSQNQALRGGGISIHENSTPVISQCSFMQNSAISEGGGIYNDRTSPAITNCSFFMNTAPKGGGLNNFYSPATVINCSFSQNNSTEGGGIYNNGSLATITNTILWANTGGEITSITRTPVVTNSIVQGGYSGTGNLNADPMFTADLHLKGCSPAINAGTATGAPAMDIEGKPRPVLGGYDMGAYEFQSGGTRTTLYVDGRATGRNDGTSWANAYTKLQDALNKAGACFSSTQVWVAAGIYYPDETATTNSNDRYASFTLSNNTQVYGGFAGTEHFISQRDCKANETILSGEIDGVAGNAGNAYHVVRAENVDTTAMLDGFIITGGNANDTRSSEHTRGGGIYVQGTPRITNCIFRSNHAESFGGGIVYNSSGYPVITNCVFWGNSASVAGGGLSNFSYSSTTIRHCSFYGNTAPHGGAIHNMNSGPNIINSILWGNSPEQIYNQSSTAYVNYSLVQDGYYPGKGNLKTDPLFVNQTAGDLHLQACSPAIDAGNQALENTELDLDGQLRTVVLQTDMGAYEFQGTIIYVKPDATGRLNGTSWANAFTSLQDALSMPTGCSRLTVIWVAQGTYYPDLGTGLTNNDRTASFRLKNSTAILGGFAGIETSLAERIPASARYYKSILSGEIDGITGNAGNAYHVVRAENVDSSAILDGFTITGGNANGSTAPNNAGGGLYNTAVPTLRYCNFTANTATNGGALFNGGNASIINSIFTLNKAAYGGAIYNLAASPTILNGLFWKNTATSQGGAIYNSAASPRIINNSFNGNTASSGYGGAIRNVSTSTPTIINSILWGDTGGEISNASSTPIVSYSLVQGGYAAGSYIISADPLFADVTAGKLGLKNYPVPSPAIDAGNNAVVTLASDVYGDERIYNSIVDMGADEFYPGGVGGPEPLVLICPADFTLQNDPGTCGAVVNFIGEHAANTTGGNPPVTITYDPAPGTLLPVGDVLVTVTAMDAFRTQTGNFWVTVIDTAAPVITNLSVDRPVLYPPNHKMQEVQVNYNVSDNCPGVTTGISVTCNQPQYGTGSGDTGPDWQMVNDHKVKLRSERSGSGGDRIYTITIMATDAAGNTATATTTVTVPHDNRSPVTMNQAATIKEVASLVVTAVPNPSAEGFTLYTQSPSNLSLSIKVMDAAGRMIESRRGVLANGTLYIGNTYRPGVYYLQVMQGDVLQTIKLIKQSR